MWCGIIAIVAVSIILLTVFRIISMSTLTDRAKQVIFTIYQSARDAESGKCLVADDELGNEIVTQMHNTLGPDGRKLQVHYYENNKEVRWRKYCRH